MVRHPKEAAEAARAVGRSDLLETALTLAERRHWTEAASLFGPLAVSSPVLAAQLLLWLYAEGRGDVLRRVDELVVRRDDVAGFHALRSLCLAELDRLGEAETALRHAHHLDRHDPVTHLATALVAAKKDEDIDRAVALAAFVREGGNPGVVAYLVARVPELAGNQQLEEVFAAELSQTAPVDVATALVLAHSRLARNDREPLRGPVGWTVARLRGLRPPAGDVIAAGDLVEGLAHSPSDPVLQAELRRLTHHLRSIPWMLGTFLVGGLTTLALHHIIGGAFAVVGPLGAAAVLVALFLLARHRGETLHSPATQSWARALSQLPRRARLHVAGPDGEAVLWSGGCVCADIESLVGKDALQYVEHLGVERTWDDLVARELVCATSGARFVALGPTSPEARGVARLAKLAD
ncbi:MAG: hypothetical protein AB7O61_02840 [Acidimicrobiia bacterium]